MTKLNKRFIIAALALLCAFVLCSMGLTMVNKNAQAAEQNGELKPEITTVLNFNSASGDILDKLETEGWCWYQNGAAIEGKDYGGNKVLFLNGLNLKAADTSAILVPKGTIIFLAENSQNRIVIVNRAIMFSNSMGDRNYIEGNGTLDIVPTDGNANYVIGLDGNVVINGGNINIDVTGTTDSSDGIMGNYIEINGGKLNIRANRFPLFSTQYLNINSGEIELLTTSATDPAATGNSGITINESATLQTSKTNTDALQLSTDKKFLANAQNQKASSAYIFIIQSPIVARIGQQEFTSVQEAFRRAMNNSVVQLVENVGTAADPIGAIYCEKKGSAIEEDIINLTLDLNGKELYVKGGDNQYAIKMGYIGEQGDYRNCTLQLKTQ